MFALIVILALSAAGAVATAYSLPRDGYRRTPTDWTRLP